MGKCYETHPALVLVSQNITGTLPPVYGGSCGNPGVDADIYIGFDRLSFVPTSRGLPWTEGYEVSYPIVDMGVPTNPKRFKELVDWTLTQMYAGHVVHAGCIGGHGRTGMFLAALVAYAHVTEDAITWVRKHYCEKAVESTKQVEFLHEHFGITKAEPAKAAIQPAQNQDLGYWRGGNYYGSTRGGINKLEMDEFDPDDEQNWETDGDS